MTASGRQELEAEKMNAKERYKEINRKKWSDYKPPIKRVSKSLGAHTPVTIKEIESLDKDLKLIQVMVDSATPAFSHESDLSSSSSEHSSSESMADVSPNTQQARSSGNPQHQTEEAPTSGNTTCFWPL